MTVTYVYCFSLLELSNSNKLIWYHSICLWIHFSQKHLFSQFSKETTRFFHNFQTKRRDFFTIFNSNDTIFSQLVWYRTHSQFWKKNAETTGCLSNSLPTATSHVAWIQKRMLREKGGFEITIILVNTICIFFCIKTKVTYLYKKGQGYCFRDIFRNRSTKDIFL